MYRVITKAPFGLAYQPIALMVSDCGEILYWYGMNQSGEGDRIGDRRIVSIFLTKSIGDAKYCIRLSQSQEWCVWCDYFRIRQTFSSLSCAVDYVYTHIKSRGETDKSWNNLDEVIVYKNEHVFIVEESEGDLIVCPNNHQYFRVDKHDPFKLTCLKHVSKIG